MKNLLIKLSKFIPWLFISALFIYFSYYTMNDYSFGMNDDVNQIMMFFFEDKHIPLSARLDFYNSRFLPFQFQDFNLIYLLGLRKNDIELAVFIFIVLKVLLLIVLFILVFKETSLYLKKKFNSFYVCFCIFILLFSKHFLVVIAYPSYSEITQGISTLLFIIFLLKAYRTDKTKYYVISLLSAIYGTYQKETMFVVFLTISLMQLLFNYKKLNKKKKVFFSLISLNSLIFLMGWFFIYLKSRGLYNPVSIFNLNNVVNILKENTWIFIIFTINLFLMYKIFILKNKKDLLMDSILFSATGFIFAHFVLAMPWSFYYLISLFLFMVYSYYLLIKSKYKFYYLVILSVFLFYGIKRIFTSYYPRQSILNNRRDTKKVRKMLNDKRLLFFVNYPEEALRTFWYVFDKYNEKGWESFLVNEYLNLYSNTNNFYATKGYIKDFIKYKTADYVIIQETQRYKIKDLPLDFVEKLDWNFVLYKIRR